MPDESMNSTFEQQSSIAFMPVCISGAVFVLKWSTSSMVNLPSRVTTAVVSAGMLTVISIA